MPGEKEVKRRKFIVFDNVKALCLLTKKKKSDVLFPNLLANQIHFNQIWKSKKYLPKLNDKSCAALCSAVPLAIKGVLQF